MYSEVMKLAKDYLAANGCITTRIASYLVKCSVPTQILKKLKGPDRNKPSYWGRVIISSLKKQSLSRNSIYRSEVEDGKVVIYLVDMPSGTECSAS
jgi:hypothetical protein